MAAEEEEKLARDGRIREEWKTGGIKMKRKRECLSLTDEEEKQIAYRIVQNRALLSR